MPHKPKCLLSLPGIPRGAWTHLIQVHSELMIRQAGITYICFFVVHSKVSPIAWNRPQDRPIDEYPRNLFALNPCAAVRVRQADYTRTKIVET